MESLKLKVEKALVAWMNREFKDNPTMAGVRTHAGHTIEPRTLPCVIVNGDRLAERDEFPPGTGVFNVMVKVFILTQADDENLEAQDRRVATVHLLLTEPGAVKDAINVHAENRPVKDLHVYDLSVDSEDEGRDGRHHGHVLSITVVCQNVDGVSEPEGEA